MQNWIRNYVTAQKAVLDSISVNDVAALIERLQGALRDNRHIFIFGNGGSAANSSHFATDLGKGASDKTGRRFRVQALNDNISWMTAIGNDYRYDDIFVRQLVNFGRPGDVAIGVSVSGSSPNVVKAIEWAAGNGLRTVALVGGKRGKVADVAEQVVVINDTHYGRVEDAQMGILHMLCYAFMENPELGRV